VSSAAEDANLWIHEFLEAALDQHEDRLRAKDGVDRHRRRRGAPRLQNAQLRVTQSANKRLRQIASRHNAPLADVVRTLVAHALADVEAELDTQFESSL
jgi:predicted DNA-binding protein